MISSFLSNKIQCVSEKGTKIDKNFILSALENIIMVNDDINKSCRRILFNLISKPSRSGTSFSYKF